MFANARSSSRPRSAWATVARRRCLKCSRLVRSCPKASISASERISDLLIRRRVLTPTRPGKSPSVESSEPSERDVRGQLAVDEAVERVVGLVDRVIVDHRARPLVILDVLGQDVLGERLELRPFGEDELLLLD